MSEQIYRKTQWFNAYREPPVNVDGLYEVIRTHSSSEPPSVDAKGDFARYTGTEFFRWEFDAGSGVRCSVGGYLGYFWWRGIVYDTH